MVSLIDLLDNDSFTDIDILVEKTNFIFLNAAAKTLKFKRVY